MQTLGTKWVSSGLCRSVAAAVGRSSSDDRDSLSWHCFGFHCVFVSRVTACQQNRRASSPTITHETENRRPLPPASPMHPGQHEPKVPAGVQCVNKYVFAPQLPHRRLSLGAEYLKHDIRASTFTLTNFLDFIFTLQFFIYDLSQK